MINLAKDGYLLFLGQRDLLMLSLVKLGQDYSVFHLLPVNPNLVLLLDSMACWWTNLVTT